MRIAAWKDHRARRRLPGNEPAARVVDEYADACAYRRAYEEVQKEAVNCLIQNLDRDNVRKNGLLPVMIVDDAMTTERLLTLGAGIIVRARLFDPSKKGQDKWSPP